LILDFGDAFLLNSFLDETGLVPALEAIQYGNPDTLYSMVYYYVLSSTANCHAYSWWEGNYIRLLYPNANLTSQRISDFLSAIGKEESQRRFFEHYLSSLGNVKTGANILIDSTGIPNNIRFPLTAISNHNGEISNEVRLIYITDQKTGLPIYFRYCPGNVVDVSTLTRTIKELKQNGVNTKLAILDAGYYSDDNLLALYEAKISFVTRLKENKKLYKSLIANNTVNLEQEKNLIGYNGRYMYIKCVKCELISGFPAYAYIGLDIERKASETKKLFQKATAEGLSNSEVYNKMLKHGIFILFSSKCLETNEIMPIYYTRQQIEQVFDIGKNYAKMTPPRIHGEPTIRGHLLLTFISTVIIRKLQIKIEQSPYNPISLFLNLRNQKCKVYKDRIITSEAFKKANDAYKLLGITCPVEILR
jgi:hypothetical protein